MAKVRTTLTIDEDVLRVVKVRGARTGKGDSEVIEDSLRRELGPTCWIVCGSETILASGTPSSSPSRRSTRHGHAAAECAPSSTRTSSSPHSSPEAERLHRSSYVGSPANSSSSSPEALLAELAQALAYPKIRNRVAEDEATKFVELLREAQRLAPIQRSPSAAPPISATTTSSRSPRRSELSSSPATSTYSRSHPSFRSSHLGRSSTRSPRHRLREPGRASDSMPAPRECVDTG